MPVDMTSQSIAVGDNWVKVGNAYIGDNPTGATAGSTFALAPSLLGMDGRLPKGDTPPDIVVSGNTTDRGTITISTSTLDFGTEPVIYLDWTGASETVGAVANFVSANGATASNPSMTLVDADGVGQSKSFLITENGNTSYLQEMLLPDITQCFSSFKYKNNGYWSGTSNWPNGSPEKYVIPNDSTWKMLWFFSDLTTLGGTVNSNLCVPSHIGDQDLAYGGNSHNACSVLGDLRKMAVFEDWSTVETFFKSGVPVTDPSGQFVFNLTHPVHGRRHQENTGSVFAPALSDVVYKKVHFTGWIDDHAALRVLMSDVYFANIPSRVVIGDHPILSKCRYTSIARHLTWASQSITAEMRVPHDKDTNLYAFVINANGVALSETGSPVSGGNL